MEVHDWLRQRIIFFVLFSRGFHQFNFRPIPEIKFPPDFFVSVSKCRHAGTNRQKENYTTVDPKQWVDSRSDLGNRVKQCQTHEIAVTGMVKMSARSAGDHFIYVYLCLFCSASQHFGTTSTVIGTFLEQETDGKSSIVELDFFSRERLSAGFFQ